MAQEGYLPPVVTKFIADLTDLARGVATAKTLVADYAHSSTDLLANSGTEAGRLYARNFATEIRAGTQVAIKATVADAAAGLGDQSAKQFADAGSKAAMSFGTSFSSVAIPLLVGAVLLASPAIITAIAGAVQLGLGLGFIGLGAFMLRQEPALIAAAVRFKDRISAVFETAAAPMLQPFITALNTLGNVVEKLSPQINAIFAALAPAIGPLATGLAGMFESMAPGLTEMLVAAGPMLIEFAAQLPTIGAGVGDFFHSIAVAMPGISAFIRDAGPSVASIFRGLGWLVEKASAAYKWMSDLHQKMKDLGVETPFAAMGTAADAAGTGIKKAADATGEWFTTATGKLSGWWDKASEAVSTGTDKVVKWFEDLPGKIGTAVEPIPGKLADIGKRAFDRFFFELGFGMVRLGALWVGWVVSLPGLSQQAWGAFSGWMSGKIDEFVGFWQAAPGRVGVFLSQLWATVVAWSNSIREAAITKAKEGVDGFVEFWQKLPDRVVNAVTGLWGRLSGWAADLRHEMFNSGDGMITGLIDGWLAKVDWAVGVIERAAGSFKRGFNKALGIDSPSKVFAEAGRYSVEGYVWGITANRHLVSQAWQALLRPMGGPSVTADMRTGFSGGAATAGAGGPAMLEATINIDGQKFLTAITPAAQQRKVRTGSTGLA